MAAQAKDWIAGSPEHALGQRNSILRIHLAQPYIIFFCKQQGELRFCLSPSEAEKVQFAEILSILTRGKKPHLWGFSYKMSFFSSVCHRETIRACKTDNMVINMNSSVIEALLEWFLWTGKCVYLIFLLSRKNVKSSFNTCFMESVPNRF